MRVYSVLYFLVIFTFLQDLLQYFLVSFGTFFDLLDELILFVLFIVVIISYQKRVQFRKFDWFIFIFVGFYLLSSLVNLINPVYALIGFRDVLQYVFLYFIVLWSPLAKSECDGLVKLVFVFATLNVVVLFFQWIWFIGSTGSLFIEDSATGLMGINGAHILGFFLAMIALYYFTLAMYKPKDRPKYVWFKLFILLFAIVLTSARALFFFLPLVLLLLVLINFKLILKKNPVFLSVFFILGLVAVLLLIVFADAGTATLRPSKLVDQQSSDLVEGSGANRVSFLGYSYNLLSESGNVLFGNGPGSYVSKTGMYFVGEFTLRYVNDFPFENEFVSGGSQLNSVLVELGLVGTIFLYLLLFSMFFYLVRMRNKSDKSYFVLASAGVVLLYIFSSVVQKSFEIQVWSMMVWLMFALSIKSVENDYVKERKLV